MLIDRVHLGDRTYPCLSFLRKLRYNQLFWGTYNTYITGSSML